jgi:4,4'-diaponeurosporenoate glycosyltransferase
VVALQAGLAVIGWLAGWVLLWHLPRLSRSTPGLSGPVPGGEPPGAGPVVVVPARNEEANLPRLLDSLAAQRLAPSRVVVVDDGSVDATASAASARPAAERVRLVPGRPPPAGWTGKSWALDQGLVAADPADGEFLVFLDADVTLAPGALAALHDELARRGGLVSVAPYHRVVRLVERASSLFNVVAIMGIGAAWPSRGGQANGANGACLACKAGDYRWSGGHARTPGDVLDDVALAASFRRGGLPVWCLAGADLVAYRMYTSWSALVEGWSKNIAAGAGRTPLAATLGVVVWLSSMLAAGPVAVAGLVSGGGAMLTVGLATYLAYTVQLHVHLRRLGRFGALTPWAHPVLAAVFVGVFVRSLLAVAVRRELRWRGRPVPTRVDR